jgi:hypothetical protein
MIVREVLGPSVIINPEDSDRKIIFPEFSIGYTTLGTKAQIVVASRKLDVVYKLLR